MLEYTLEEARTLLQKNITQAKEASDVVSVVFFYSLLSIHSGCELWLM